MKVTALAPYPEESPSTRFRLAQFRTPLRDAGIELAIRSFTDPDDLRSVYEGVSVGGRLRTLLRGLWRRRDHLSASPAPDLFLVHRELSPVIGKTLLKGLRRTGVPYVYDFDDAVFLPPQGGDPLLRLLRRPRAATAELCGHARLVLAGNEYLAAFAHRYAREVVVLPTVVDTERFRPRPAGPARPADGPPVVGWVGSHTTLPELLDLYPALQKARSRTPFRLRVVCNRAPAAAPGLDMDFVRWRPDREVEVFHDMDVGLYPLRDSSWSRGKCGFKAIEYLACGVPAVASPVGVIPDIVEHGRTGLLASSNEEWAEALVRLLHDPDEARRMAREGRQRVEARYSRGAVLPALVEALRRAAA